MTLANDDSLLVICCDAANLLGNSLQLWDMGSGALLTEVAVQDCVAMCEVPGSGIIVGLPGHATVHMTCWDVDKMVCGACHGVDPGVVCRSKDCSEGFEVVVAAVDGRGVFSGHTDGSVRCWLPEVTMPRSIRE